VKVFFPLLPNFKKKKRMLKKIDDTYTKSKIKFSKNKTEESIHETIKTMMFGFGDNDSKKKSVKLIYKTIETLTLNLIGELKNNKTFKDDLLIVLQNSNPSIYRILLDFMSKFKKLERFKKEDNFNILCLNDKF